MLFMFNCLDLRTDVNTIPKFNVIINNVSIYEEFEEVKTEGHGKFSAEKLTKKKRVDSILAQLKEVALGFYLSYKVSDDL